MSVAIPPPELAGAGPEVGGGAFTAVPVTGMRSSPMFKSTNWVITQPCCLFSAITCSHSLSAVRPIRCSGVRLGKIAITTPAVPAMERTFRLVTRADTRASLPAWAVLLRLGRGVTPSPKAEVAVALRPGGAVSDAGGLGVVVQA